MAKNTFIQKLEAQADARLRYCLRISQGFAIQLMTDLFSLEMRRAGITKDKVLAICKATNETYNDFAQMWEDEKCSKTDPNKKIGARTALQNELEKVLGDQCLPWAERYEGLEDAWEMSFERRPLT